MDAATPRTLAAAVCEADAVLAVAPVPPAANTAGMSPRVGRFVEFTVGSTCYAAAEAYVTELRRIPKITIVPRTPAWLRGVANVRGDVVSAVDLRVFIGMEPTPAHTGRMLIARLPDEDVTVGLLVDGVDRMITVEHETIRPPASPLEGPLAPYLTGVSVVDQRLVAVLDLARLLRSQEIRQFEDRKEDGSCEAR